MSPFKKLYARSYDGVHKAGRAFFSMGRIKFACLCLTGLLITLIITR